MTYFREYPSNWRDELILIDLNRMGDVEPIDD